jgi:hypothetical protein
MSWAKRPRFWIVAALVVVVGGLFALALLQTAKADRNGVDGKAALARAEDDIDARNVNAARADLLEARGDFQEMQHHLSKMGPIAPVVRNTPFVRVQIRGAHDFAVAGELISNAGLQLVNASAQVIDPTNPNLHLSAALGELQTIRAALNNGINALDSAADRIRALDGYRLVGPLNNARDDLKTRLPRVGIKADSALHGLDALIDMLGGSGPRRFLIFSQNPDEVRPTGGFIGTYGVMTANNGHVTLDQFAATSDWYLSRPQAVIYPYQAPLPLQLDSPEQPQTLANANATADFSAAGQVAAKLWHLGGEPPIDGVVSMTPAVMARVVGVLGPVKVPGYPETITAANLVARVDFHTHFEAPPPNVAGGRKAFLIALVHVVVQKILDAPASQWQPLATAIGQGFDAREAMGWSNQSVIQDALIARGWDGTLPQTAGDFFYDGEFEYAAKNGGGLHRTFDHNVVLNADGSAKITTKITIDNTLPPNYGYDGTLNIDSLSFITVYGPDGAALGPASDPPDAKSPDLSAHPAYSWFEAAKPRSSTTFTVVWNVPHLLLPASGGAQSYQLDFMKLPAHPGDVLHLHVTLPPGWKWSGAAPPASTTLDHDLSGTWRLVRGS